MLKVIKSYMMPFAMILGAIFHQFLSKMGILTPYLIFTMLFLTFSKMQYKNIRIAKLHIWLLLIQLVGSILSFILLSPINEILAQGVLICIIAPTATAAPVITGILKGNVESITIYSLLSNLVVVIFTPLIFTMVKKTENISFITNAAAISKSVVLFVFAPLLLAFLIKIFLPKINNRIAKVSYFSFWLWIAALSIVTAKTVSFMLMQSKKNYFTEIALSIGALTACVLLFASGKYLGKKYNDEIAGGQSLGQKNTILAIWMSQTYLNPLSSIAPGMYVIWQNLFNSWQIWRKGENTD